MKLQNIILYICFTDLTIWYRIIIPVLSVQCYHIYIKILFLITKVQNYWNNKEFAVSFM